MNSLKILFGSVVLAAMVTGCGIPQEKYDADMASLQKVIDKTRAQNMELQSAINALNSDKSALEKEMASLQAELQRLTGERDANAKAVAKAKQRIAMFKSMLEKFKKMQESGKIKIKIVNNKMVVEMQSSILFPSGSARLSEDGKEALSDVAQVLSTIKDRKFQVAGHTDNKPIKNRRFKSNWELSSARAVSVVRHMIKSGMLPENLSAAGYADTQPVASNETAEGRAQNRRIEIVLQPNLDELPDLSALEKMID
jgi:chemotaxis protein MotB